MLRLILSIIAGILASAIPAVAVDHLLHVTGVYPPYGEPLPDGGPAILALSYRVLFTVLAAYSTALIAREKAMMAVLILGTIGSLLWLGGAIAMWDFAPAWYNILGIASGVPLTLLGGKIYQNRLKNKIA